MHIGHWSSAGILVTNSLHLQNKVVFLMRSEALVQTPSFLLSPLLPSSPCAYALSSSFLTVHRFKADTIVFLTVHRFMADTASSPHPWTQPLSSFPGPKDRGLSPVTLMNSQILHLDEVNSQLCSMEPMEETIYCSLRT